MAHDDRTTRSDRAATDADGALVHTHDLHDFKIPDGAPDPRGWDVRTADGQKLGKVSDLLVDTRTSRVRYIEVEVDKDAAKRGGRDWALIPIGAARLDDGRDDVVVEFSTADVAGIPAYERQRLSRDYEASLRTYVRERRPVAAAPAMGDRDADFYAGAEYDDRSFFTRRGAGMRGAGMSGAGMSGAADRATTSGVADRVADRLDDLKDRVDANPASRPGPDATDRPLGPR